MLKHACINDEIPNEEINKTAVQHDRPLIDFIPKSTDVSTYFDQINWDKLPNSFVIKCNHGCKWQYIIKDKKLFLQNKRLFELVKKNITGWLEQDYSFWGGFEMQYATSRRVKSHGSISGARTRLCEGKVNDRTESTLPKERYRVMRFLRGKNYLPDTKRIIEPIGEINEPGYSNKYELRQGCQEKGIEPKILIEPYIRNAENIICDELNIYCFFGIPLLCLRLCEHSKTTTLYDEFFNVINDVFCYDDKNNKIFADEFVKSAYYLSRRLAEKFLFVRVDWIICKSELYFLELTFTPYSGFNRNFNKKFNKQFGNLLNLERF